MIIEKMHAEGNDFCILEYIENIDYKNLAIKVCNRKTGIGCDTLIVIKPNPIEVLFYNPDGTAKAMSGNGIRCAAKYLLEHNMLKRNKFDVLTIKGKISLEILSEYPFMVKVNMAEAIFNNQVIYVSDILDSFGRIFRLDKNKEVTIYSFYLGTIHTVIFVPDFNSDVLNYASYIANNKMFTRKTNVDFVRIIDKENVEVKTYDKHRGFVESSGTGACAAVVAAAKLGLTKSKANVNYELGSIEIEIKRNKVFMTGTAVKVFECEYKEEKLC